MWGLREKEARNNQLPERMYLMEARKWKRRTQEFQLTMRQIPVSGAPEVWI